MARKSNKLDKKLLHAGAVLLKKKGIAAISVRDIVKKADVNLGMFNYHFGSKDRFIKALIEEVYSPFIVDLQMYKSNVNKLEEILFRMACFSRDHHESIISLFGDVLSQEKNVILFLRAHFTKHFSILYETLELHFEANGYFQKDLDHSFRFLISTVGMPNLLAGLQGKLTKSRTKRMDSDDVLRKRVQAGISGLSILCE